MVDSVPMQGSAVPLADRARRAPWVLGYYTLHGTAPGRIAAGLERQLAPWAAQADLMHNARIGRVSFASFQLARQRDVPFVFTVGHHPLWGGRTTQCAA